MKKPYHILDREAAIAAATVEQFADRRFVTASTASEDTRKVIAKPVETVIHQQHSDFVSQKAPLTPQTTHRWPYRRYPNRKMTISGQTARTTAL